MKKIKVLFVCMGNICRSPAGEGVFRHYITRTGHADRIDVDSAGTIDYHAGSNADPRMREAAGLRGYRLDSIARRINAPDISGFDLIITMDEENLYEVEMLANGPRPHIRMLGTFLPDYSGSGPARPVPDPYYGGAAGFEAVLDMIEQACPGILDLCMQFRQAGGDEA